MVDPLPESMRGGFNEWVRVQASDEAREVRGSVERNRNWKEKAADAIFSNKLVQNPEMT